MSTETAPDVTAPARQEQQPVLWSAVSALGVLLAGIVVLVAGSLIAWGIDHPGTSTVGSAARVGLQSWYLAHAISLPVSWGSVSIPPLLITGLIALFSYRSGRSAVRACGLATASSIAEALAAMAITYTTVAVILTSVAYPSGSGPAIVQVAIMSLLMSTVPSGIGMVRESGIGTRALSSLPGPAYAYVRGASATLWALGALSAFFLTTSLIINFSEASSLSAALSPTGLGGLAILAICVSYLPNAMLLTVALATGAGFSLGAGSSYGLTGITREALPTFPLFAALPHGTGPLLWLVVLVPIGAGVAGALTMTRFLERDHRTPANLIAGSALSSALCAVAVLVIAMLALGSLGDGRLASVGASPFATALRLFAALFVATTIAAFIATSRSLTPAAAARRKRALSVIETNSLAVPQTEDAAQADDTKQTTPDADDDAAQAEDTKQAAPDAAGHRPVIASKLAMRRLMKSGKATAAVVRRKSSAEDAAPNIDVDDPPTSPPAKAAPTRTAPRSSLSVVKRAAEAKASGSTTAADESDEGSASA